jgi:hypothetical protein
MGLKEEQERLAREAAVRSTSTWMDYQMPKIQARWPFIPDSQAHRQILIEACGGDAFAVTVDAISLCMEDTSGSPQSLPVMLGAPIPRRDQKEDLISEILRLLKGTRDEYSLKQERTRLSFSTLQQLRARRDEIVQKQELVKQPIAQLQQTVRSAARSFGEYKPIPAEIPGEILGRSKGVPWSFKMLNSLDPASLRKCIRLYGADAINQKCQEARLRGEN